MIPKKEEEVMIFQKELRLGACVPQELQRRGRSI